MIIYCYYSKNVGSCILYKLSYFEDNLWGLSTTVILVQHCKECLVVVCQHISCGNLRDLCTSLQGKLLFCIVRICYSRERSARPIYCSCERASEPFTPANRRGARCGAAVCHPRIHLTVLMNIVHIRDVLLYDSVKYL